MQRRTFLKATLVTAGAASLGLGCGTDDDPKATPEPAPEPGTQWFPQSIASGDPRPDSVILWTRIDDAANAGADLEVQLQVASDEAFSQLLTFDQAGKSVTTQKLTARAGSDHCVKVRVTGLEPGKTWFYRFLYPREGKRFASRTGQVRTAPEASADVPVRFAVVSCQDYNGKAYNTYKRLAGLDVDFFLHLGDYVYETTGNPEFQETGGRRVKFTDEAGAIAFHAGTDKQYHAAKSLSNYRELYRTYRGDGDLQRMHERAAMIAIWDDHEFSDDCFGATATYFDGAQDEHDPARRAAADQAWFEYMPVDYPDPAYTFDPKEEFPGSLRIWRDLAFGKHVQVVMTDLRRYRSDHIVPEDAFPGAVCLTQAQVEKVAGQLPASATAYFDVDAYQAGKYAKVLKDNAAKLGLDPAGVQGLLGAAWVNARVATLDKDAAPGAALGPIPQADIDQFERGYVWSNLLKNGRYSSLGARYLVVEEPFLLLAKHKWQETGGKSETAMGDEQEKWFLDTVAKSTRTWKIWGNELTLTPRRVDLGAFATLPEAFKQTFLLSAEDWDGMPNRRDVLLDKLSQVPGTVAVTGDIHAFFAGTPWVSTDPSKKIPEFVTGAISSGSYETLLFRQASSDPVLVEAGAPALALLAGDLLMGEVAPKPPVKPNPSLTYQALDQHGFLVLEAGAAELVVTMHQIAEEHAATSLAAGAELDGKFATVKFRVQAGKSDVQRDFDGTWKTWDPGKGWT